MLGAPVGAWESCRPQAGCGGGCSCVLYPPLDVFGIHSGKSNGIERHVDILLQQVVNQTTSASKQCVDFAAFCFNSYCLV